MKKLLCVLFTCIVAANCLPASANAAEFSVKDVVWQDDLEWEQVDLSAVKYLERDALSRSNVAADGSYSEYSIYTVTSYVYFQARRTVTFNCSYSPSSASMDFGVLTPDGRFYFINVKGGSINQALEISQAGNYAVAIRNNSSQTVRVVGFVEY